jgi:hypothetical protein
MKKILMLLIFGFAAGACYDDYILDYDYDAIYFPYQYDVRTFVVGEGMQIKMGVALGGVRENDRDRLINFQLDNSLISPASLAAMQSSAGYIKNSIGTELKLLPSDYYSLSHDSEMVIKKGDHSGTITLTPDSAAFLTDPDALTATYAIPLRIVSTNADADSVLSTKDFAVIALKYESMLFGNYWHGGRTIVKDPAGTPIDTILYNTTIPQPEASVWKLSTVEPFALTSTRVSNYSSDEPKPEIKISLGPDGSVIVGSVAGATYVVEPDGPSTFNQAKLLQNRKILLNYKYQDEFGNSRHATDTLTFRNRIRDGVNEWQDENPDNYN